MASADFENVLELVEHMCEELVDNPEALSVQGTHVGVTGAIEITGPSDEIAKIIGSKRTTITAIEVVMNAVAAKYGFRVLLNVMNTERRKHLEEGHGRRAFDDSEKDD
jgi:predicted RNA-binding protein YlqC (UPF0109 family)